MGESACWLHLTCRTCATVTDQLDADGRCPACGATDGGDGGDSPGTAGARSDSVSSRDLPVRASRRGVAPTPDEPGPGQHDGED